VGTQRDPQEIKNIVLQVIGRLAGEHPQTGVDITGTVEQVFSERERKHLKVAGLKNGTLFLSVDSPAQAYQFNLNRVTILRAIQKKLPDIQKIYFKTGKVV
jgi:hypothetical protein